MARLKELFELYKDVTEETLFENLVYFLNRIKPVCQKYGIRMAIHPDDPVWPVFGLPRIVTSGEKIQRLMKAVDDPFNGVTLCTGSSPTPCRTSPPHPLPEGAHPLRPCAQHQAQRPRGL